MSKEKCFRDYSGAVGGNVVEGIFFLRRKGFTLAEILITLAIIGVVAALTIPTLVANYQEKQTVVKLKKMYSVLSQGFLYSVAEGDPITNYSKGSEYSTTAPDTGVDNFKELSKLFFERFKPYLKIAKECGNKNDNCIAVKYKSFDGSTSYTIFSETTSKYIIKLADGSSIVFFGYNFPDNVLGNYNPPGSKLYGTIYYDINGTDEPNTFGKDMFQFALITEGIAPYGRGENDYMENCYHEGFECAPWVISQNNMNYLHCKDLSENGKLECD